MAVTRQDFEDAVAAYWNVKNAQHMVSAVKDKVGSGTAGSVRGGKHFDGLSALLAKFFLDAGFPPSSVHINKRKNLVLPGYYRPQKLWDVVIVHNNTLVAAFEFKALGGPSFGNNYSNRIEEALGSAADTRRAAAAELYPGELPWLGYFFLLQDEDGSQSPVRIDKGAFPVEEMWQGLSYGERCAIFLERLNTERIYDAVCYVTSSPEEMKPNEPVPSLDWQHFSAAIHGRIEYFDKLGFLLK